MNQLWDTGLLLLHGWPTDVFWGNLPPLQLPQDPPHHAQRNAVLRGFLGLLGQLHCLQGLHDFLRFCRPRLGSVPDSPFKGRPTMWGPPVMLVGL
jgi:hypothetical protein